MTEEKYEIQHCIPEAAILVCTTTEPKLTLKVMLTSPQMKDDLETEEQGLSLHVTYFLSFFFSKQEVKGREGWMNVCVCIFSDGPLEERALVSSLLCIQNSLRAVHIKHTHHWTHLIVNTHTHIELIQQQWSACCQTLDPRGRSRGVLNNSGRRVRE